MSTLLLILVCIFPHSDWIRRHTPYLFVFSPNAGKWGPEKLQIPTLFAHYLFVCVRLSPGSKSPSTKFQLMNQYRVFRWFYTTLNVSRMLRRHRFFFFAYVHALKRVFYRHTTEMSIPLKIRNHLNFSTPNKCRFF